MKGERLDPPGGPIYRFRPPSAGDSETGSAIGAVGADARFLGDWNGDGVDTPGWRVGRVFHLSNSPSGAEAQAYSFGIPCDEALVGDWNGDGRDSIGVRRGTAFHLATRPGQRAAIRYSAGRRGDRVLIGDWNGDGVDTPGLVRGNQLFLRTNNTTRPVFASLRFGRASDRFVAGDWNGDGSDTPAAVRETGHSLVWFLRSNNRPGDPIVEEVRHGSPYDGVMTGRPNGERRDHLVTVRYRSLE